MSDKLFLYLLIGGIVLNLVRILVLSVFKYKTYMNNVAISNHLLVTMLQGQNVKRETVKKMDTDEEM